MTRDSKTEMQSVTRESTYIRSVFKVWVSLTNFLKKCLCIAKQATNLNQKVRNDAGPTPSMRLRVP